MAENENKKPRSLTGVLRNGVCGLLLPEHTYTQMDRLVNQGVGEMMMAVCVHGIHGGEQYTNAQAVWQ